VPVDGAEGVSQYLNKYQSLYNQGAVTVDAQIKSGLLTPTPGIPENTYIGQRIDTFARTGLQQYAAGLGDGADVVQINQQLSLPQGGYRIPDVYFPQSGTIFDGTIGVKTATTPQIVDFAIANGRAPIYIVRPAIYGGTYLIRP